MKLYTVCTILSVFLFGTISNVYAGLTADIISSGTTGFFGATRALLNGSLRLAGTAAGMTSNLTNGAISTATGLGKSALTTGVDYMNAGITKGTQLTSSTVDTVKSAASAGIGYAMDTGASVVREGTNLAGKVGTTVLSGAGSLGTSALNAVEGASKFHLGLAKGYLDNGINGATKIIDTIL